MTYKGYRLSKRGKIVFSLIIILIIAIFFYLLMSKLNDNVNADTPDNIQIGNHQQEPITESPVNEEKNVSLEEGMLSLYFQPGSALLTIESQSALDMFVQMENLIKTRTIRIEGNCATLKKGLSEAEKQANKEFALKRAEAVAEYLHSKGLSNESLEIVSNGSDKSTNNRSWFDRRLNRRVDIFFQVEIDTI